MKLLLILLTTLFVFSCKDKKNPIGNVATSDSFAISKRAVKLGQPVVSIRADTRLTKTDTTFWLSKKPISLEKPHKTRYFLIGYVGVTREGKLWTGGVDTAMSTYPNKNKLCWWVHEKFIQYDILDIKILSITEQSKEDYDTFWKD